MYTCELTKLHAFSSVYEYDFDNTSSTYSFLATSAQLQLNEGFENKLLARKHRNMNNKRQSDQTSKTLNLTNNRLQVKGSTNICDNEDSVTKSCMAYIAGLDAGFFTPFNVQVGSQNKTPLQAGCLKYQWVAKDIWTTQIFCCPLVILLWL